MSDPTIQILAAKEESDAGAILLQAGFVSQGVAHYKRAAKLSTECFRLARSGTENNVLREVSDLIGEIFPEAEHELAAVLREDWPTNNAELRWGIGKLVPVVNEMHLALAKRIENPAQPKASVWRGDFLLFFAVLIVGYFLQDALHKAYLGYAPERLDGSQAHYESLTPISEQVTTKPIYWAELGKNNALSTEKIPNPAIELTFENFRVEASWARDIFWYISTPNEGKIFLKFPPNTVTHFALFLTDGDTFWRMSRIRSGDDDLIADQLHDGRWFLLKVSAAESSEGKKVIQFNQLTGNNVAVSALVGFREGPS